MYKQTFIIIILMLTVLAIAACESIPPDHATMRKCRCEQLPDFLPLQTHLLKQDFPNDEQFVDEISETYQISKNDIRITKYDSYHEFTWTKGRIQYRAGQENSILTLIHAEYVKDPVPTARCVIECWGSPERYKARYDTSFPGPSVLFGMLFPNQGTVVFGMRYFDVSQKEPPAITDRFPMDSFNINRPGRTKDVLHQMSFDDSDFEEMLQAYKPWPENWEDIVIDHIDHKN